MTDNSGLDDSPIVIVSDHFLQSEAFEDLASKVLAAPTHDPFSFIFVFRMHR